MAEIVLSIITPVYNGADYIGELLQSTSAVSGVEHIVIDDGSDDEGRTLSEIRKFSHVKVLSRENRGQIASINEGLMLATGDYVSIISADDFYLSGGLEDVLVRLTDSLCDDVIYGDTVYVDQNGERHVVQPLLRVPFPLSLMRYRSVVSHCSLFVRRAVLLEKEWFWDSSYRLFSDWDWISRVYSESSSFGFIKVDVACYRVHSQQVSTVSSARSREEIVAICKKRKLFRITDLCVQAVLFFRKQWLVLYCECRSGKSLPAVLRFCGRAFMAALKKGVGLLRNN